MSPARVHCSPCVFLLFSLALLISVSCSKVSKKLAIFIPDDSRQVALGKNPGFPSFIEAEPGEAKIPAPGFVPGCVAVMNGTVTDLSGSVHHNIYDDEGDAVFHVDFRYAKHIGVWNTKPAKARYWQKEVRHDVTLGKGDFVTRIEKTSTGYVVHYNDKKFPEFPDRIPKFGTKLEVYYETADSKREKVKALNISIDCPTTTTTTTLTPTTTTTTTTPTTTATNTAMRGCNNYGGASPDIVVVCEKPATTTPTPPNSPGIEK